MPEKSCFCECLEENLHFKNGCCSMGKHGSKGISDKKRKKKKQERGTLGGFSKCQGHNGLLFSNEVLVRNVMASSDYIVQFLNG